MARDSSSDPDTSKQVAPYRNIFVLIAAVFVGLTVPELWQQDWLGAMFYLLMGATFLSLWKAAGGGSQQRLWWVLAVVGLLGSALLYGYQ